MDQMGIERRSRVAMLLKASDPVKDRNLEPGVEDALDELGSAIMGHARPRRSAARRRFLAGPRGLVAIGAALLVLAGGATAATQLLGGRDLHYAAPDFCRKALRLSAGIPYPAGYSSWRRWVLVSQLEVPRVTTSGACDSQTQGGRAVVGPHELRGFFAMSAFCAWVYDWRDAERAGDHAAAQDAAGVIGDAPRWPAVRAEDAHPTASQVHETRYGLQGQHSLFGWLLPFRHAVQHGDTATVDALIASNYGTAGCSWFKPLAGSHGGTVLPRRFRHASRS